MILDIIELHDGRIGINSSETFLLIWDYRTLSENNLSALEDHDGRVTCMLRMGKRLLTGSEDSNIKMWDPAKTDACKRTFAGHSKPIICMVRVEKRIYASASRDHTIRLWDA